MNYRAMACINCMLARLALRNVGFKPALLLTLLFWRTPMRNYRARKRRSINFALTDRHLNYDCRFIIYLPFICG